MPFTSFPAMFVAINPVDKSSPRPHDQASYPVILMFLHPWDSSNFIAPLSSVHEAKAKTAKANKNIFFHNQFSF